MPYSSVLKKSSLLIQLPHSTPDWYEIQIALFGQILVRGFFHEIKKGGY